MQKKAGAFGVKKGQSKILDEQFRMLRTSLHYLGIGSKAKRVLITSTIPGDGKSFVTANLGLSLAMAGKKVVIVEFDLSNPTLSEKLNMPYKQGLADYLVGSIDLNEAVQRTSVNPNLYFINAGNLPDNPSDIILSERVNTLLSQLDNNFDLVLLDTAPVGVLADGYVLARKSDATLFVVRHGHTPKRLLRTLGQNNQINELKNIGIVFNGVSSRGFVANNSGYGYGYGYTYTIKPKKKLVSNLN
jgi:capsular exopolysaccharide synthesis family protein